MPDILKTEREKNMTRAQRVMAEEERRYQSRKRQEERERQRREQWERKNAEQLQLQPERFQEYIQTGLQNQLQSATRASEYLLAQQNALTAAKDTFRLGTDATGGENLMGQASVRQRGPGISLRAAMDPMRGMLPNKEEQSGTGPDVFQDQTRQKLIELKARQRELDQEYRAAWDLSNNESADEIDRARARQRAEELAKQGVPLSKKIAKAEKEFANYTGKLKDEDVMRRDIARLQGMDQETIDALYEFAKASNNMRATGGPAAYVPKKGGSESQKMDRALKLLRNQGLTEQEIDELSETVFRARNAELAAWTQNNGQKNATILGNLASIPGKMAGAVIGTMQALNDFGTGTGRYSTMDSNLPGYDLSKWVGGVRAQTAQNIEGGKDASGFRKVIGKLGSVAYNATMSAVDSLAGLYVAGPSGALAFAGMDAFQSKVQEASVRGASPTQAMLYGTAAAATEILTEKISIDNLIRMKDPSSIKALLKNAATQGMVEVSEEEISFVGQILADAAILGENSEFNQSVQAYQQAGMTEAEAKHKAHMDLIWDAVETAATSFLSGGMMSAAHQGKALGEYKTAERVIADQAAMAEALLNFDQTAPQNAVLRKTLETVKESGTVTNSMAERILNTPEAMQELIDSGAELGGETRSQQRKAVKDAVEMLVAELYGTENVQSIKPDSQTGVDALGRLIEEAQKRKAVTQMDGIDQSPDFKGYENTQNVDLDASPSTENNVLQAVEELNQKSVGEEPSGLDPYTSLQYQYGKKPSRSTDVRQVNVPNRDSQGRRVSDFTANAYGAAVVPDSFIPVIEDIVQSGGAGADTKTFRETLESAAAEIERLGVYEARRRISREVAKGNFNDNQFAMSQLLFAKAANSKDARAQEWASELFLDMEEQTRYAGRTLNLAKMFRRLTPEGQLATIETEISRYVEKRSGKGNHKTGKSQKTSDANYQIDQHEGKKAFRKRSKQQQVIIPEELKTTYLNAKTENERADAMEAIYKTAASQIPGTLEEKVNAWRYMAMLGNLKTNVRNFVGNEVFRPYVAEKRVIGAAIESIFVPKEERTKSVIGYGQEGRALLDFAKSDAKTAEVKELLTFSAKTGDAARSKIDEYRSIFKTKELEQARRFIREVPEAADMFAKRQTYASSLAGFLKARGFTAEQARSGKVSEDIMMEARAYSAMEAMKATFNDLNAFSDFVSRRAKSDNPFAKAFNLAMEGVMPFRRTPANILVRAVDYSPIGLLRGAYQCFTKVKSGKMTAAEAIDTLSAGLVGTGNAALGFLLHSLGIISSGSLDDDEERIGRQPYSLNIFGKSYTIDWLAPVNLPFFVGAELHAAISRKDENADISTFTAIIQSMGNLAEPMLELSCLSSLNDIISTARYAEDGSQLSSLLFSAATSYFMQGIPTAFGQFDQAADKNRKTIFANSSDPVIRELQRLGGRIFQKLPGDFFQTEVVDEWGRTESKGNFFTRVFNAFLNPSYVSDINETSADKAISEVKSATGENVSPKTAEKYVTVKTEDGSQKVRLSADQWDTLAKTQGQSSYDLVSKMLEQDAYNALSDTAKANAIQSAYNYAREIGRMAALPDQYKEYSETWMTSLNGDTGETAVASILKRAAASDVGAGSETQYDAALEAGFSQEQMREVFVAIKKLDSKEGKVSQYDKYREVLKHAQGEDVKKWFGVLGMTDSQLKGLDAAIAKRCTVEQYISALEQNGKFDRAFRELRNAWDEGTEPDISILEQSFTDYKNLGEKEKGVVLGQSDGKTKAYINLRIDGLSAKGFAKAYRKYTEIGAGSEDESQQARQFSNWLDNQRWLTDKQREDLRDRLGFYKNVRVDAGKYEEMTQEGVNPDRALNVSNLLAGLNIEPGSEAVRPVQKWESIAEAPNLTDQEELAIMRIYMSEDQYEKYTAAMGLGLEQQDYFDFYRQKTARAKKDELYAYLTQDLGYDAETAKALMTIYGYKY